MYRIKARQGQRIKRGQVIGWVGSTGKSTGPHCHYEVHINGHEVNPVYFFFNDLNAEQYDRLLKMASTGSAKSFD
jgi:murein DD-endopeptidase MepM/ murein hydrolase activator NlpD